MYVVNCTVRPEGLGSTLLVFRSIPRPIPTLPSNKQLKQAEKMYGAMKAVGSEQENENRVWFKG